MINNQWQWIQVTVTAHTLQCYIKELQTVVNEPICLMSHLILRM